MTSPIAPRGAPRTSDVSKLATPVAKAEVEGVTGTAAARSPSDAVEVRGSTPKASPAKLPSALTDFDPMATQAAPEAEGARFGEPPEIAAAILATAHPHLKEEFAAISGAMEPMFDGATREEAANGQKAISEKMAQFEAKLAADPVSAARDLAPLGQFMQLMNEAYKNAGTGAPPCRWV